MVETTYLNCMAPQLHIIQTSHGVLESESDNAEDVQIKLFLKLVRN